MQLQRTTSAPDAIGTDTINKPLKLAPRIHSKECFTMLTVALHEVPGMATYQDLSVSIDRHQRSTAPWRLQTPLGFPVVPKPFYCSDSVA